MSIEPVDEAELAKASAEAAAAAADGARGSQDDWVQRTPPPSMDAYLPVLPCCCIFVCLHACLPSVATGAFPDNP